MPLKNIRIWGTYYSETDKGRKYQEEYDVTLPIDTELSGGYLLSHVQKKVIDKHLLKTIGPDKYLGWQTCSCGEVTETVKPISPSAGAFSAKAKKANNKARTSDDLVIE